MPICNHDGLNIHFKDNGEGAALILLHGLGSHGLDWESQELFFRDDYRIITIDLRGHGDSQLPEQPYTISHSAADVLAVMDQLSIQQAHIVGFSMGGMVAFQLATQTPSRLLSLSIINSGPYVDYSSLKIKCLVKVRLAVIRLLGMKVLGSLIARKLFPSPDQLQLYRKFVDNIAQIPKQAYIFALKSFLGWDVSDKIHLLSMPVLIIAADQDYIPLATTIEFTQLIPDAQLTVIENSRHATPMDQPDKLNQVLQQFLINLTPATP